MLQGWGLPVALANTLDTHIQAGITDPAVLSYYLQDTPEYKQRFAGNVARQAAGLPVLSPAQYLSTEASYRSIMASAGLPPGFYDKPDDFVNLISSDVSPSEVQTRVDTASKLVNQVDPSTRNQLQSYYGIDSAHLVAHFLDPQVAAPILQRQAAAAEIGAAATQQGLAATTVGAAEKYADQGVTAATAQKAYGQIAQILPTQQAIANRFGQQYTQGTAESELLGGDAAAQKQRELLNQSETALFSGDTGLPSTVYGGQNRAASLGDNTQGAY